MRRRPLHEPLVQLRAASSTPCQCAVKLVSEFVRCGLQPRDTIGVIQGAVH
jgi:hypothetical protein